MKIVGIKQQVMIFFNPGNGKDLRREDFWKIHKITAFWKAFIGYVIADSLFPSSEFGEIIMNNFILILGMSFFGLKKVGWVRLVKYWTEKYL